MSLTETEAKRIQGELVSEMRAYARKHGITQKEADKITSLDIAKRHGFQSGIELRRALQPFFQKPKDGKPHTSNPDTIKARYCRLLQAHDHVPSDAVMNDIYAASDGTLASLRSRLKKDGYEFQQTADGGWLVKRPAPPISPSAPLVSATPPAPPPSSNGGQPTLFDTTSNPDLVQAAILAELRRCNAFLAELPQIKGLLAKMVGLWV